MKRHLTDTNLFSFSHYTLNALDSCKQVDVIYSDFNKALDKIGHNILLNRLTVFGFSGVSVDILHHFYPLECALFNIIILNLVLIKQFLVYPKNPI